MSEETHVYDETDGQEVATDPPAQPSVDEIVAKTTEAILAKIAPLLQQRQPEPEPEKPRSSGDPLLDGLRGQLGLEDDGDIERVARARALKLLKSEYGDDAAVQRAIDERIERARPLESVASLRREMLAMREEFAADRKAREDAAKRDAQLKADREWFASDKKARETWPALFRGGKPSAAVEEIFATFSDPAQLRAALNAANRAALEAGPRRPSLGASGGTGAKRPKPSKFLSGSEYDAAIRDLTEEMGVN